MALSGHETDAREALQRYLALPSSDQPKTIAGWKAYNGHFVNANTDPRLLEAFDRYLEGLRKAGCPSSEASRIIASLFLSPIPQRFAMATTVAEKGTSALGHRAANP